MDADKKIRKKIKIINTIFRIYIISTFFILLILILNKEILILRGAVVLESFLFAFFIINIFKLHISLPKEMSIASSVAENVNEAQKIISTKKYMMEKYFIKNTGDIFLPINSKDFFEIINSFIVGATVACIGLILSFNPAFLEMYSNRALSISVIFKLMGLCILQILFFGMAVSCVLLKFFSVVKGVKK